MGFRQMNIKTQIKVENIQFGFSKFYDIAINY